jgi:DNA-directed RNA polymerase beta' subunit
MSIQQQETRKLTETEINFILDFIIPNKLIPEDISKSINQILFDKLHRQLKNIKIYPKLISKLKKEIIKNYYKSLISPGESIGIIAAMSIGEKQTQSVLNSFHSSGAAQKTITGVPRFQELLNATKSPKYVNGKIFFNHGNKSIQELRETINYQLVNLKLKDIMLSIKYEINKEKEIWYDDYKIIYCDDEKIDFLNNNKDCLSLKLDNKILYKYRLYLDELVFKIESEYDDVRCIFSPPEIAQLDIFINLTNIKLNEKQILFVNEGNYKEIYIEECVQPLIEKVNICGIEKINELFFNKDKNDEWYVETDGVNFRKLLGLPLIDMSRLQSNNMWDIYENAGIEAVRQFLIDEFMELMDGINESHVYLLVDKMTFLGTISSITRYTMKKDETGPCSRGSFEQTLETFINAGFQGEIEKTNSISSAIICGKRGNIGTGFMDLKIDINKLINTRKSAIFYGDVIDEDV